MKKFTVRDTIEVFNMTSPWKYINIPYKHIKGLKTGGWGSITVYLKIGKTEWKTSLFPMKKEKYFAPIKKAVCRAEGLVVGQEVRVVVRVV